MEKKKLYRSSKNKMLGGVCGGLGEFFNLDPTLVRLIFIILVFLGGGGILFYLFALIIVPLDPDYSEKKTNNDGMFSTFIGAGLIFLGIIILLSNFGLRPFHLFHFSWSFIFAAFLILVGFFLIFKPDRLFRNYANNGKPLAKSSSDKMIFGVCGGIGEYFKIDATFVRLFWVFFTLTTFGVSVIIYLTLALVLPNERFIEKEI